MIVPIDEIPKNMVEERKSYRERIRNDIQEAIDKGISKFEFVGDYNFKTLRGTAQEEADRVVYKIVLEWKKKHPDYDFKALHVGASIWSVNQTKHLIQISSVKGETPDKRRVFCKIQPDMEEKIKEYYDEKVKEDEARKQRLKKDMRRNV